MSDAPQVHALTQNNLDEIARMHRAAFPDSLLSRLGHRVVRRYYLELQDNGAVSYGAFAQGALLGFGVGGETKKGTRSFLARNKPLIAAAIIMRPRVLTHPDFRDRLRRGRKQLRKPVRTQPRRSYGILVIAVDPVRQGRGIGGLLMEAHEATARQRGFTAMHLTVADANQQGVQFYRRQGFDGEYAPNRGVWKMQKDFSAARAR